MKQNLTISSVGDISFSTGLEKHSYDFTGWISKEVRDFLKADIQIGNLECVFYPNDETRPPGFNLSEKDTSAEALVMSGFDVLSLANNHICDYFGYKGIEHTIAILEKNNIKHCGAGINISEAQKPTFLESNGFKIGVFGRIHRNSFENIIGDIATENNPGAAPLCLKEIVKSAKAAKKSFELDIIILAVHWGIQDLHNHTSEIHNLADAIAKESDVDFILGSHSHCTQGIKSGNSKVICYGQGNFYFYPQVMDEGILYSEDKEINRTSIITKINISRTVSTKNVTVESRVVEQDKRNTVVFVDNFKERKILRKVFGIWQNNRPIYFFFEYRFRAIAGDLGKLVNVFKNPVVRKRFLKLISNPRALGQKILTSFFSRNYK
jgi:hypothetical protein